MFRSRSGKSGVFLVLVMTFGLILQACSSSAPAAQPQPEAVMEPMAIKVALLPFMSFAPFFIAQEEGIYERNGLEVEFVQIANPQDIIPAVTQGQVDASSGFVSVGFLNTVAKGGKIRIVSDKGYIDPAGCPSNALLGRKGHVDAGVFDNPANLKGMKVDVLPTSWNHYYLDKLLNSAGLTIEDMEVLDLPTPAEPEALTNGNLDVTVQGEPWITRIRQAGHVPILTPIQELMPDSQFAVIFYGPTLLDENQEAGRRFMTAYLEAVAQYNQGKTERNLDIISKHTRLDKELLQAACWPALRPDGAINAASVLDFQSWAVQRGYIETPVTEAQMWDSAFVDSASQRLSAQVRE